MIMGVIFFGLGVDVTDLRVKRDWLEVGHDLLLYIAELQEVNLGSVNIMDNNSFAVVRYLYVMLARGRKQLDLVVETPMASMQIAK